MNAKNNKEIPGVRHVNPKVVQDRIKRDLQDRLGERSLNDPLEKAHQFIRDEAATPDIHEQRTINRAKVALKRGEPQHLSASEKIRWEAEAKRLESWLVARMVTRKGINLNKPQDADFQRAVRLVASVEMSTEFTAMVNKWKNIMRTLYYDEPEKANLERIRPN